MVSTRRELTADRQTHSQRHVANVDTTHLRCDCACQPSGPHRTFLWLWSRHTTQKLALHDASRTANPSQGPFPQPEELCSLPNSRDDAKSNLGCLGDWRALHLKAKGKMRCPQFRGQSPWVRLPSHRCCQRWSTTGHGAQRTPLNGCLCLVFSGSGSRDVTAHFRATENREERWGRA